MLSFLTIVFQSGSNPTCSANMVRLSRAQVSQSPRRGCNKNHIIRATLDSLCYQVNDVLHAMEADSGIAMKALKVDGGACANNYLMQTMADISSLPVERPCCVETTALGAAYLAGLAVGYWQSTDEVVRNWSVDRTFLPDISAEERTRRIKGWNKAVRCAYHWALDEE